MSAITTEIVLDGMVRITDENGKAIIVPFSTVCQVADQIREMYAAPNVKGVHKDETRTD